MKKICLILMTALAFTACSSDDPVIDNGGTSGGGSGGSGGNSSGGNSWTDPTSRKTIPAEELTGKWVFDSFSYDVQADDADAKKSIIAEITSKTIVNDLYPKTGTIKFTKETYVDLPGMFAEGGIRWNYKNMSDELGLFGDYFSNGDTIFYYHWTLKEAYNYMLKKNDRLIYHYDDTYHFQITFRDGGVKKVIYYAKYARIKE